MGIREALRIGTGGKDPVAPAKAVVAAAMPMNGPGVERVNRGRQQSTTDTWQKQAWYYFDVIGELRGPLVWIANAVSQADVHATELDPDTGKPTGPTDNVQAQAAAALVLGGPSQRGGLLRLLALCWQVPGESWVVIRPGALGKPDTWLVLSGNRVNAKGELWQYTDPLTGNLITLGPLDRLIRVWSPHPDDQAKADSAVRPALPICQEIEKASQSITARLDSRLKGNGVYWVPEEVDYPRGDHETTGAALMDMFLATAEASLQNPGQASAQVPIVLTVPGDMIANVRHDDLGTTFDSSVVELRQDSLRRLAATLDMPKDVAEGTQGQGNHWSSWQVEESTYKIFIEPLLKAIGDALTAEWFRPALIAMGFTPEQAEGYELGWDTTAIVARPDDTENLRDLHDRLLISDDYMRAENGIPDDAAPNAEEYTRRFFERAVTTAPTLLSDPVVAKALGLEVVASPAATGAQGDVQGGELTPTGGTTPSDTQQALPATQGQEPAPADVPDGLVAAAELIVYDALSRAGGRLLTNQNRGQFKATPRHELHTVIRPDTGDVMRLMGDSFEFTGPIAEAFNLDESLLRRSLSQYVSALLVHQAPHRREELRMRLLRTVL